MTAKHYVLFASQPYSFSILRPLQQAIRARGDEARWFVSDDLQHLLHDHEARLLTHREVRAFRPDAVFSASNWVPLLFPGLKVQLFHGFSVDKRKSDKGHFRIRGMFDLYCTQGPSTTGPFRQLAEHHGYFKVVETGWTKMDSLFLPLDATKTISFANPDLPVIMFASTFTESLTAAPHLYEPIRRLIATGKYNWLLTLHPKMNPAIVEQFRALESANAWYFDASTNIEMLKHANVLVSDTSSIVAEFLLLEKPVVTFRNRKPGEHLLDFDKADELPAMIETALARPAPLLQAIRANNALTHPFTDGKSSERVLTAVENFHALDEEPLKKRPLNLLRRLQQYYKVRKNYTHTAV